LRTFSSSRSPSAPAPDGGAAGARFSLGSARAPGRTTYAIVGVAARVRLDQSDAPMGGGLHVMHRVIADNAAPLTFVARLASPLALGGVTRAVRAVAGDATARVGWMDDRYAVISAGARIAAVLTAAFELVAVSVAMVGLYGVTAFLVAGRRRGIPIRIALGAGRRHIRRLVIGPSIRAAGAGVIAGLAAAAAAARVIGSQLFGVTSSDPSTYAGVLAVILLTMVAATWRPARRATRVDPAIALRAE
jgi:hypothetical protein